MPGWRDTFPASRFFNHQNPKRNHNLSNLPDKLQKGVVFNIQKFSVHDGPGIRTLVFLKGCTMRCQWCSNPESQKLDRQLAYNSAKCLTVDKCQRCQGVCPHEAISVGDDRKIVVDFSLCDNCLDCAEACPALALNVYGYEVSVDEALQRVEEDEAFYSRSGGGLTLSGGEPLYQSEFTLALLREAKKRRIDTCIETCGNVPWPVLKEAAANLDSVYFDLKTTDDQKHQEVTGVSNQLILSNLKKLKETYPDLQVTVRTPVISGVNDTEADIAAIAEFIKDMPCTGYELLAYHRMGMPKYGYLGMDYLLQDTPNLPKNRIEELYDVAREILSQAPGCEAVTA
jgi:pyruvate formate lyase activating enzyme